MAWTYSGNPSDSDLDTVRWLVGDTDDTNQIVQDEEIEHELAEQKNVYAAASTVCEAIAAKFAGDVDFDYGHIAENASQAREAYEARAERLRTIASSLMAPGFRFTGNPDGDTLFTLGMHDNG